MVLVQDDIQVRDTLAFIATLREQRTSWETVWHEVARRYPWRPWTSAEQVRSWYRRASVQLLLPRATAHAVEPETTITPNGVTVVFADLHIPYHYEPIIEQALLRWMPDHIILAGDTFDFDELSHFPRDHRTIALEDEFALAGQVLHALLEVAPVTLIMGNHERRLVRTLQTPLTFHRFLALTGVTSPLLTALQREYLFYHDTVLVGHGWSSAPAGREAAKLAVRYRRHVLLGHVHHCGAHIARLGTDAWLGASIGCACRFERMWYHARRAHAVEYQRGYGVLFPDGSILVCDERHAVVAGVWTIFGTPRFLLS